MKDYLIGELHPVSIMAETVRMICMDSMYYACSKGSWPEQYISTIYNNMLEIYHSGPEPSVKCFLLGTASVAQW